MTFTFSWFDQIVLLLTGLVAVYLIYRFIEECKGPDHKFGKNFFYMLSFAVLFVAGVLLIFNGYELLATPWVVVVSALIPFSLSVGLVKEFHKKYWIGYLVFVIIGLVAIGITRCTDAGGWATVALAFFHGIAGLVIFFIPIFAVKNKKAPTGFIWVTIGGTLISIGGISLAFLKAGSPILSADVIFTILAPILLLMSLAFAWGFMKK